MSLCSASRLSHLDKTPIKSIKSGRGDLIDCVDINHQPAFDHPLLKDHEIQVNIESADEAKKYNSLIQSWQLDGQCPDGTIAMRRITKEEPAPANSININFFSSFRGKSTAGIDKGFPQVCIEKDGYYGGKAIMNLWEPHVRPNEFSASYMALAGDFSAPELNVIAAGWHVVPKKYGGNRTRFFAGWRGANSTGCLNLECAGFVQISNEIALGATFPELSSIDGSQFEFSVMISKGEQGWMLQFNDTILGYWPYSLFTTLGPIAPASTVQWGGAVLNSQIDGRQSTTTEMGSGHFAEEGFGRASYMRQLQVMDETSKLRGLESPTIAVSRPSCYNMKYGNSVLWGDVIFFGGPGRNPNCP
ncbi:OLC1v1001740C1 [Oldenlandia corymbosa var. corymbosa]|uniref:OLC1v1001740C1 n=1 Tax=Oldenlandia corymbosa var. corymbosa TaxID=529605 RepID=A0AAV1D8H4_OLDCO|nr:OLC1v1001740C1 [Oldenlandia corymbosa var. corymbosa]